MGDLPDEYECDGITFCMMYSIFAFRVPATISLLSLHTLVALESTQREEEYRQIMDV
jgi:hypothetical protein